MDTIRKNARIRAVHAACRALGLDDTERRQLQMQITGKASMKDMSAPDLGDLLDHLNRRAAGKGNEWGFVFRLPVERQTHAKKIYRLAERLGAAQTPPVGVMGKRYIEGIAEKMVGAETALEFCGPELLHKIVQALEVHCKRIGA